MMILSGPLLATQLGFKIRVENPENLFCSENKSSIQLADREREKGRRRQSDQKSLWRRKDQF